MSTQASIIRPETVADKLAVLKNLRSPAFADAVAKEPRLPELAWFLQWHSMQAGGLEKFVADFLAEFSHRIGTDVMRRLAKTDEAYTAAERQEVIGSFPEDDVWHNRFDAKRDEADAILDVFNDQMRGEQAGVFDLRSNPNLAFVNKQNVPFFISVCKQFALLRLPLELADFCANPDAVLKGLKAPELWYFKDLQGALLEMLNIQAGLASQEIVTTQVSSQVFDAIQFAWDERAMVEIIGDSRFGKTESVKAWCAMYPGRARLVKTPCDNADRSLLEAIAAKGYRDPEHLLTAPDALWQSSKPLNERTAVKVDKAVKRRQWLTPFLPSAKDAGFIFTAIEAELIASHQQIFGYPICGKTVRDIFNQTIDRDRGREDWQLLEIYLDSKRGRKPGSGKPLRCREYDLSPIAEAVAALENPAAPTIEDRVYFFDCAFRRCETLLAENPGQERHVKRAIIRYLNHAVPLAKSLESLSRTFKTKLAQWIEGGRCPSALSDRRRLDSGNFRRPDFTADAEKIRNTSILHGGNESLAHRLLRQRGELSNHFVNYFKFNPRHNKSYVPATLRAEITPDVDMCGPIHRGPHEAKMRGPYIQRNWSDVQPGQWFNADDVTWNSYFYFTDSRGQLQITRGECLLFIDLRTGYPLDFSLIAGKYNGEHIRIGIQRIHDLHGLPSKGFYLERGVWKSRLIVGETNKNLVHWRDAERGLREYGLDMAVRHATTPRAKPIEGLLRILQERQRSERGFVGFNERLEKMERVQDIIARCKRGTEDPRNHFLSQQEWSDRISKCLGEYLHDPQNGKMLDGQSPAELWETRQPLSKLPDEARYILSTHRVRVKVRQEGIVLTIRGKRLAFYNEQTGAMIGRDVFAFYNIEQPELLTVSDLNRQNFFTVKNHTLPAMSASKEQFAAVNADRAGHMNRAKVIYGSMPHPERKFIVRDNAVDDESKDLGRFHNAEVQRFQQNQVAVTNARSNRLSRGHELLAQTSPEIPAPEQPAKKIYILDPAPAAKPSTGLYWALWAKVEKVKPGLSRHALTQKAIGCHCKPQEMTPDQLAKMIDVFSAIIRDASAALAK